MILDLTYPVEPLHPLVQGRVGWWYGVSGSGGRLPNIMPGNRNHARLVGNPVWGTSIRGNGVLRLSGSGQYAAINDNNLGLTTVNGDVPYYACGSVVFSNTASTYGVFSMVIDGDVGGSSPAVTLRGNALNLESSGGGTLASGNSFTPIPGVEYTWGFSISSSGSVFYLNGRRRGSSTTRPTGTSGPARISLGAFVRGDTVFDALVGSTGDAAVHIGTASDDFFAAHHEQAFRGYRTPDPMLRWIRGTAFGLPLGGGGGSVRIPRFILQTRRRLTGVS